MLDYKRFISYLYTYVEGEKGVNVGYIRCEQRQGLCRFTLSIQDRQGIEGGRYKVYLYKTENDETPIGYFLDEIVMHKNCGELRKQTNCENVWNTNSRMEDFDGVIIVYDKEHMYASQWTDARMQIKRFLTYSDWKDRKEAETVPKAATGYIKESEGLALHVAELSKIKEEEKEKTLSQDESPAPEEFSKICSQELAADLTETLSQNIAEEVLKKVSNPEKIMDDAVAQFEHKDTAGAQPGVEKKVNAVKQKSISDLTVRLMEKRPKLPDFENHEIYDCVRIEPNDIGLLEMENWRLGVNSFLTHGYYNYKYLMLGKLRFQDGVVKAVLGVPGIYDNKEQYIAKIFGFELFVPVKHTNVRTGNFGYWIVELV